MEVTMPVVDIADGGGMKDFLRTLAIKVLASVMATLVVKALLTLFEML